MHTVTGPDERDKGEVNVMEHSNEKETDSGNGQLECAEMILTVKAQDAVTGETVSYALEATTVAAQAPDEPDDEYILKCFEQAAATRRRRIAPLALAEDEDGLITAESADKELNSLSEQTDNSDTPTKRRLSFSEADNAGCGEEKDPLLLIKERSWTEIETDLGAGVVDRATVLGEYSDDNLVMNGNVKLNLETEPVTAIETNGAQVDQSLDPMYEEEDVKTPTATDDCKSFEDMAVNDSIELEWGAVKHYDISGPIRGKVLLIQMEHFSTALTAEFGLTTRLEAEVDARDLKFRLRHAGFHVQLVKDPSREEVLQLLTDYTTLADNLENTPSFMLILMTHSVLRKGEAGSVFALHDGFISREELISPLANCHGLSGKPKIFIFQAVKSPAKVENVSTLVRNASMRARSPLAVAASPAANAASMKQSTVGQPDVLVVDSAVSGFHVFKNARSGSLYLQLLAKALEFNVVHPSVDFVKLLVRLNGQVASTATPAATDPVGESAFDPSRPSPAWASVQKRKQTATFSSTFTKALYLYA
ncbi:hypothetical protein BV898_12589 [Hypsibius exemplaris]|uniref:Caspase family p20 domain-containing protein n=1 Tax=Hypsibius exemplaris TaxID=2072580 RepID=A0A1W0WD91_HYPEX|nr:hypothetical protein BV898_12589 [Hypsibius exemplaris]